MPLSQTLIGTNCVDPARPFTADRAARLDALPWAGAIGLGLPVLGALLLDPRIGASMIRLAHVAHSVEVHRRPAVGDVLQTTATLAAIRPDTLGELLDVRLETRAGSTVIVDATATLLWRGPRRRDGLTTPMPMPTHAQSDAEVVVVTTDATTGAAMAAVLGDHNPIHVDEDAARQAGLPGPVLPHLGVLAQAAAALGNRGHRLRGHFVRPALVGDTLRVAHQAVGADVAFSVTNQEGVVVIDDGLIGGGA
jgi:acyl dehydratase